MILGVLGGFGGVLFTAGVFPVFSGFLVLLVGVVWMVGLSGFAIVCVWGILRVCFTYLGLLVGVFSFT